MKKEERKGLLVYPQTQMDAQTIKEILEETFVLEWNVEFGYYFIEEEEDNYDELETIIDDELREFGVYYRVEGIF